MKSLERMTGYIHYTTGCVQLGERLGVDDWKWMTGSEIAMQTAEFYHNFGQISVGNFSFQWFYFEF